MRWPSWDRQRFGMDGELAALATVQHGDDENLDAKLMGPCGPSLCRCIPLPAGAGRGP